MHVRIGAQGSTIHRLILRSGLTQNLQDLILYWVEHPKSTTHFKDPFDSNSSRNRFLKDKSKHKLWNKLVDVKPYIYNPDKVKNSGPGHLVIGKGQVKMTTETSLKAKAEETKSNEAKNMSIIEKQMSDLQV